MEEVTNATNGGDSTVNNSSIIDSNIEISTATANGDREGNDNGGHESNDEGATVKKERKKTVCPNCYFLYLNARLMLL